MTSSPRKSIAAAARSWKIANERHQKNVEKESKSAANEFGIPLAETVAGINQSSFTALILENVAHSEVTGKYIEKLKMILHGQESQTPGVLEGSFGVGIHALYSDTEPILMTLGVPGYSLSISFDGSLQTPVPELEEFLQGETPKHGLHLEKLAGRLYEIYGYELNDFYDINPRQDEPALEHHGIERIFLRDLTFRPSDKDIIGFSATEWMAIKNEKAITVSHIRASGILAVKAHWIGRVRNNPLDRMGWCNIVFRGKPDLQACIIRWCHDTTATNAAARACFEVDYANERISEMVLPENLKPSWSRF
jgi:hypothetical protein